MTDAATPTRPQTASRTLLIVGKLLFVALFTVSGIAKFVALPAISANIASVGLPAPATLAVAAGLFEIAASIAILLSFKLRIVGPLLGGYCVLTALLFHGFWAAEPAMQQIQFANFMKNLSLAGACLWFAVWAGDRRV